MTEEFLSRVLLDTEYKPDYNIGFPAKRITTELDWEDMILDYQVEAELEEINTWISSGKTIMEDWGLSRFLKAGYRSLFYGPPGTGKTLAATLLGKKNRMDVYRIDLSMIVSKYIGETEKKLARVFDLAENRNWILFFDEADALFGILLSFFSDGGKQIAFFQIFIVFVDLHTLFSPYFKNFFPLPPEPLSQTPGRSDVRGSGGS